MSIPERYGKEAHSRLETTREPDHTAAKSKRQSWIYDEYDGPARTGPHLVGLPALIFLPRG